MYYQLNCTAQVFCRSWSEGRLGVTRVHLNRGETAAHLHHLTITP